MATVPTNAPPSVNPANNDSLLGTFREILKKFLQGVDDMMPARVIAFDRATNRVQVQLLVMVLKTDGETVPRNQLASLPVFQIGGGNFMLNFPLKPGDLGWVKATDRDTSLFLQSYDQAPPNTLRLHSFQDGVFFPDTMRGFTIDAEDTENVVLQTLDGSVRVALWEDRAKVTAPLIILDSPLTHATGDFLIDGNLGVDGSITGGEDGSGDMLVNGSLHVTGSITADVQVTAAGIPLSTHKHTGVQTGGSNTGNPTP